MNNDKTTYPIKGHLSENENSDFDLGTSAKDLTYNSASTLRSSFYSELLNSLSKDLTHPKVFKIAGGILLDSP